MEGVEFVPGVVPGLAVLPAPGEMLEMKMLGSGIRNLGVFSQPSRGF